MQSTITRLMLCCAAVTLLFAASCKRNDDDGVFITPRGAAPAWGPSMTKEMLAIIEELDSFYQTPIEQLPPQSARMQKTIFDAAGKVAQHYGLSAPVYTVDAADQTLNLNGGQVDVRIYRPRNAQGPHAAIVYYGGGGWVLPSLKTYDGSARAIAEQTGAVVVNVEYRKGPEFKFPTAHNDAFAAYKWVLANATFLNINPSRIAVVGESAGGNLACNVSIMARDSGVTMPKHQVLIYPIAQSDTTNASYTQYASAKPLNRTLMNYFFRNYLGNTVQRTDPRIALINANLSNLPPTTIINAEIDPLRDEGVQLEAKLKAHSVSVTRRLYDGVTHEFFGLSVILPQARDAQGYVTAALRGALQ